MNEKKTHEGIMRLLDSMELAELETLKIFISSPGKRNALINIIDSLVKLRSDGSHPEELTLSAQPEETTNSSHSLDVLQDARRAIFLLLDDRESFPTTKNVINAANSAFNTNLKLIDYIKRGRSAAIEQIWIHIRNMSERERNAGFNRLIVNIPGSKQNSEYQRLFRMLTKNER